MLTFHDIPDFRQGNMDEHTSKTIRRWILIAFAVTAIAVLSSANSANAGDWIFRRSYYTHEVPPHLRAQYPLPYSRSAYRRAVVGTLPGFSVQGGFRINRIFLRNGNSNDTTIIREGWFQLR